MRTPGEVAWRAMNLGPELYEALKWLMDEGVDDHFAGVEAKRLDEIRALLKRVEEG